LHGIDFGKEMPEADLRCPSMGCRRARPQHKFLPIACLSPDV
jgi:hypothetical protein